jgi:hypothetical protein
MDGEAGSRNLHQLCERNRRSASISHGFNRQPNFGRVPFIAPTLCSSGFSISAEFQPAEVIDNSDTALAEDLKIFLWN